MVEYEDSERQNDIKRHTNYLLYLETTRTYFNQALTLECIISITVSYVCAYRRTGGYW
jgi:hypothetical protein